MNDTIEKIKKYRELLADISYIDIRIQELEEELLGISGQGSEEKTGKTNKFSSTVEQQAEKLIGRKEELLRTQAAKKREVQKIDNAMTVLLDEEREIIRIIYIENKKYWKLEQKLNLSYTRIKQIEKIALKKMEKYVV